MALAQNIVQSAWVAAALAFAPFQHVGITPHGKLLLGGQVLLAALCTLQVFALRLWQVRLEKSAQLGAKAYNILYIKCYEQR
jgi:hypothetical protein